MRTRIVSQAVGLIVLFLAIAAAACSAIGSNPDAPHPKFDPDMDASYGPRVARAPARAGVHLAVWTIDEDANLAYPSCPLCETVCGITDTACDNCGAKLSVQPATIACPECGGGKECTHCAPGGCDACGGSHACSVCEGSGRWSGGTCPACDGSKSCEACASGTSPVTCDHCDGTHVCGNCGGTGKIELK